LLGKPKDAAALPRKMGIPYWECGLEVLLYAAACCRRVPFASTDTIVVLWPDETDVI